MKIHLASRNAKKIAELERILGAMGEVEIVGLDGVPFYDEPVEDGATFADNALIKARAGFAATGLPTIADDSGLCVDALNGMPGVLSARWAGPHAGMASSDKDLRNNELLLAQLSDVPDERRGAHFTCAVAYLDGSTEFVVEGTMPGRVLREMRGTGGFGYDVLFVADETVDGRTSAELSIEEKDAISHRGKALRALADALS